MTFHLKTTSVLIPLFYSLLVFFVAVHHIMYPRASWYFSHILPSEWEIPFAASPLIIANLWIIAGSHSVFVFYALVVLLYCPTLIEIISKELRSNNSFYCTLESLRNAKNLPIVYRSIEILHKVSNGVFSFMAIPTETVASQVILLSNYMLIKYWTELDVTLRAIVMFWSFLTMVFWMGTLRLCAAFHLETMKTRRSWKQLGLRNRQDSKYMKKFEKSCRPLQFGFQGYYLINMMSVLEFLKGIIHSTFMALLALK